MKFRVPYTGTRSNNLCSMAMPEKEQVLQISGLKGRFLVLD